MSRQLVTRQCLNCRKEFKPWYASTSTYCSNNCQREYEYQQRLSKVKSSKDWYQGWLQPHGIRKALIRERGHQCQICLSTIWQGQPIPVVLDHIDGNPSNWLDDNLRIICCNCDAQTPTYKSKNRGNGRHYRRQRYKEHKSY